MSASSLFEETKAESKKYRFEQLVFTLINAIPTNSVQTFYEYQLKKYTAPTGQIYFNIQAIEQYVESQPSNYLETIKMVNDVQLVLQKEIIAEIDPKSGKIIKIINHQEIIDRWLAYKQAFFARYEFLRSEENRAQINAFLELNHDIAVNQEKLINSLNTQLFFNLFFDRHLISVDNLPFNYTQTFHSQLFAGQAFTLQMQLKIGRESVEVIELKNTSHFDPQDIDKAAITAIYKEKYQEIIRYPFSEYDAKYQTQMLIEPDTLWPRQAEVELTESVKNNVVLSVHGKLREIE